MGLLFDSDRLLVPHHTPAGYVSVAGQVYGFLLHSDTPLQIFIPGVGDGPLKVEFIAVSTHLSLESLDLPVYDDPALALGPVDHVLKRTVVGLNHEPESLKHVLHPELCGKVGSLLKAGILAVEPDRDSVVDDAFSPATVVVDVLADGLDLGGVLRKLQLKDELVKPGSDALLERLVVDQHSLELGEDPSGLGLGGHGLLRDTGGLDVLHRLIGGRLRDDGAFVRAVPVPVLLGCCLKGLGQDRSVGGGRLDSLGCGGSGVGLHFVFFINDNNLIADYGYKIRDRFFSEGDYDLLKIIEKGDCVFISYINEFKKFFIR